MLYYKCIKDGKVVGTTESQFPIRLKSFVSISEEEYRTLSGIGQKLDEVQAAKLTEINAACTAAIENGCDVKLSDGTAGHISLTIPDQINLSTAQRAISTGATEYAYHLDGALCKMFPAADILSMAKSATGHILYHQTYCNHMRAWVNKCETAREVQGISYGDTLPSDLAQHMTEVLLAAQS